MNTNDQAANQFLKSLRNQKVEQQSPHDAVIDVSAHVTINRPVRCTFVIGGDHKPNPSNARKDSTP